MERNDPLLPSLADINSRLTRNQRERSILRALVRLVVRDHEQRRAEIAAAPRPKADGRGVDQ